MYDAAPLPNDVPVEAGAPGAAALMLAAVLAFGAVGAAQAQDGQPNASARHEPAPTSIAIGYQELLSRYQHLVARRETTTRTSGGDLDPQQRLEIDGLVVDETQTKVGRDFYDVFYRLWQAPQDAFNFTVTVKERPSRGRGSIIVVQLNDEMAFQSQLQPKYDVIESAARQAVYYVHRKLRSAAPPNQGL